MNYSVKVFPLQNPTGKLVAFASVLIDDVFEVKGFKIFEGAKGPFVKSPSKSSGKKDDKGNDIYYDDVSFHEEKAEGEFMGPVQKEVFDQILAEYKNGSATKRSDSRAGAAKAQAEQNTTTPSTPMKKKMW